ncbi:MULTISPECIES: DUF4041 domain-containing protein [unclassified Afipia]|uniref:DUF4041 domain-containing protein n=1 Tax=unclassified Afipia TaxID=2642050 RepID=UPI00041E801E|nr:MULTISPECIES: DUF4041 domain-containing protein [unclassified Afipia]
MTAVEQQPSLVDISIPWLFARGHARKLLKALIEKSDQLDRIMGMSQQLVAEVKTLRAQQKIAFQQLEELGALSVTQLEIKRHTLENEIAHRLNEFELEKADAAEALDVLKRKIKEAHHSLVSTDDLALLQDVGVYQYRHPLSDAVAYQSVLEKIDNQIKQMVKKDGGAVLATTSWQVNGSEKEGRAMVRDFSKLMLRAFNAEADNAVRSLKPYKLDNAIDRLNKVAETIARLGQTMHIRISPAYLKLRLQELEITADFLQKQAEEKEQERADRARLREERKAQQEIENERERLEKERQHYSNALDALVEKGDEEAAARIREYLTGIEESQRKVEERAANTRAGYVYVISNVGSFGDRVVKIGMTRRLDPSDRIRELSDASVPFNFDIHALFFSDDAVGIETEMHNRLDTTRVNSVNRRREFFRASPLEVKKHLAELAGELLEFQEMPEALEYRQCLSSQSTR